MEKKIGQKISPPIFSMIDETNQEDSISSLCQPSAHQNKSYPTTQKIFTKTRSIIIQPKKKYPNFHLQK